MKSTRTFLALVAALLLAVPSFTQNFPGAAGNPSVLSRPGGGFYAPAFMAQGRIISGNSSTGSQTVFIAFSTGGQGGVQLPDGTTVPIGVLTQNLMPMTFDWGQSASESVTPTAISISNCPAGNIGIGSIVQCVAFTGSFSNTHGQSAVVVDSSFGLQTAINYAVLLGGGTVSVDAAWQQMGGTDILLNAAIPYGNVSINDYRRGSPVFWNALPSTTSLTAAPAVLAGQIACDATHQFCSDTSVAGSASWSGTLYGCYTLVDINGNETPCSATNNYTSVVSKAIDMGVSFTARTDNIVGWKPYLSVSAGSYALAYSVPLLTQPTTLLVAPVSAGVCTLTLLETVTPACAIANSTYSQSGSTVGVNALFKGGMQFTGYPVVTNTLAPEIGSVSALQHNPNEEAHATYAYVPGNRVGFPGVQAQHILFPITAAAQTTIGQVEGSFPLPANFMNYIGRTIEVCGLISKTSTVADTVDDIQIWWDAEGSNVTAGTPVQLSSIKLTSTGTAAFTMQFCQQLTTTVASTTATGGTIQPGQAWLTKSQTSAGTVPVAAAASLIAAVGSLNLALPAHLTVELAHTTGTDGAGSTLQGATVRVIN